MTLPWKRSTLLLLAVLTATSGLVAQQLQIRPRYVLRPGDVLELQYRLTPDLNQTVAVQPDGYLNLNVAGEVAVGGLTVQQAKERIVAQAGTRLNNPELNLILKGFTGPTITVAGEVQHPGKFELKENTSAIGAIMSSGGFTKDARSGQVIVFRKINDTIAEVKVLKLGKLNKSKDLEHDLDLEPGDMIYVPRDRLAVLQRYLSIANVGMYFNPLQTIQ